MREAYHEQLDAIHDDVVTLTRRVRNAVEDATKALQNADLRAAEATISEAESTKAGANWIESRCIEVMSLQQPVASDLRMLVATLGMLGDLERTGALAVHIAKIARMRSPQHAVAEPARATIAQMAEIAISMVDRLAVAIASRDPEAGRRLDDLDDSMDRLRKFTFDVTKDDNWSYGIEAAVDLALLGRYYERIADHAVSIARRVVFLVTGEQPTSAD